MNINERPKEIYEEMTFPPTMEPNTPQQEKKLPPQEKNEINIPFGWTE